FNIESFFLNNKFFNYIDKLIGSYVYIILVGILSFFIWLTGFYNIDISNLLFVFVYTIIALIFIIFAKDGKAFMPILCYIMFSFKALPDTGRLPTEFIFMISFGALAIILFVLKKYFIFKDVKRTLGHMNKSLLLISILLVISYLINAYIFPSKNSTNGALFTLLCIGFTFLSILLNITSNTDSFNYKKNYVSYIFIFMQIILILELSVSLFMSFKETGVIDYRLTNLGWGNRATYAKLACISIIFTYFEFIKNPRKNYLLLILLVSGMIPIYLINSRGGQGAIICITLFMVVYTFYKFKKATIKMSGIFMSIGALICLILICFPSIIDFVFERLMEEGVDPNGRDAIYKEVLTTIFNNPIKTVVGGSTTYLYDLSPIYNVNQGITFFLCHNTLISFIATLGLLGVIAFFLHEFELIYDVYKYNKGEERTLLLVLLAYTFLLGLIDNTQFELSFSIPLIIIFANMPYTKNKYFGYKLNKSNLSI
ncbi:MAG: O-antigen ligase family protein, partial [Bacilli bacterium]